jgi:hypothetical protein
VLTLWVFQPPQHIIKHVTSFLPKELAVISFRLLPTLVLLLICTFRIPKSSDRNFEIQAATSNFYKRVCSSFSTGSTFSLWDSSLLTLLFVGYAANVANAPPNGSPGALINQVCSNSQFAMASRFPHFKDNRED